MAVCDGLRCESTTFDPLNDSQDWHAPTVNVRFVEYVLYDTGLLLRHLFYVVMHLRLHEWNGHFMFCTDRIRGSGVFVCDVLHSRVLFSTD